MKQRILILLIILFIVAGGSYLLFTNLELPRSSKTTKEKTKYSFYNCDIGTIDYNKMTFHNNLYYITINSYKEYCDFKQNTTILDMTKEDFNDKFMIVTAIENVAMKSLTLSQVFK